MLQCDGHSCTWYGGFQTLHHLKLVLLCSGNSVLCISGSNQHSCPEISGIHFENWYCVQGLARYQISVVCGEDKAALLQWLKRNVAWGSICWRKTLSVWTGQFESPVAYILLSWGASWFSSPPCQFSCLMSWERDTYSTPLSSLRKRKDLGVNCWWNSKPLDTKWRDKFNQTR